MSGDFAAKERLALTHALFDEGGPTRFISAVPPTERRYLARVAGAQIVTMVARGASKGTASASNAVTKSPDTNSPVPSTKNIDRRPSQAMPMSAFCAITAATMSRGSPRLRIGLGFGIVPSISSTASSYGRQAFEQSRRDQAGHAAAGVEHDFTA